MSENESTETTESGTVEYQGVKYVPFTSSYAGFDDAEVKHTFHFRKPGRSHLVSLSKAGQGKQLDAAYNVLLGLVLPDERDTLKDVLSKEYALTIAFSSAIMERCGIGSVELGNQRKPGLR